MISVWRKWYRVPSRHIYRTLDSNVVWDKLLPAFHAAALPANADEEGKIMATLAKLAVPEGHMPNTLKLPGTR